MTDEIGNRYGRLTVMSFSHFDHRRARYWNCTCDCGVYKTAQQCHLRSGTTLSCGCLRKDTMSVQGKKNIKHGHRKPNESPEYSSWHAMKYRCLNPRSRAYKNYGARGISIYLPWIESFEEFYNYVGKRPSLEYSLDRIDNDKGYFPGNVRWATAKEQRNNSRQKVNSVK